MKKRDYRDAPLSVRIKQSLHILDSATAQVIAGHIGEPLDNIQQINTALKRLINRGEVVYTIMPDKTVRFRIRRKPGGFDYTPLKLAGTPDEYNVRQNDE